MEQLLDGVERAPCKQRYASQRLFEGLRHGTGFDDHHPTVRDDVHSRRQPQTTYRVFRTFAWGGGSFQLDEGN